MTIDEFVDEALRASDLHEIARSAVSLGDNGLGVKNAAHAFLMARAWLLEEVHKMGIELKP